MRLFTDFNNTKTLPAIFYFSLIWIAGFFFFPSGQLHNQAYILLFVTPCLWLICTSYIAFKPFLNSKLFCLTSIFCIYYALSTLWGTYANTGLLASELKRILYLYIFWLAIFVTYYLDEKRLAILCKTIIGSALLGLCLNLIYFYYFLPSSDDIRFHGFGRLRNELWVAAIFGALAILNLTLFFNVSLRKKYLHLVLYGIFFVATLLTHSRGPVLSLITVSFLILYTSNINLKSKYLITFFSFVFVSIPFIIQLDFFQSDISRGQSYRLDLWIGFLKLTKDYLLLGHGAGTNMYINAPGEFVHGWSHYHNVYLGSLVELGLVGLLLHVSLVCLTIYVGWHHRHHLATNIALMIFVFSSLIGITYGQGVITRVNAQWIVFWLPLAIIIMQDLKSKNVGKFSLTT